LGAARTQTRSLAEDLPKTPLSEPATYDTLPPKESKHANAWRIWVAVLLEDEMLLLSIRDDGVGGADARQGSGLTGLTDRIEALGGKVSIESPRGSGTSIEVQIPTRQSFDR
jgi:nitrate/nitrite-specific signal transduction histidine kinase